MKPVRKAVFPVAGLGTRFFPATKASPKEMLAVVDKPLIQVATMLEKPQPEQAPSTLAVAGRYVLTPGVFDLLAKSQRGVGGEIHLTDAIEKLTRTEKVFAHRYHGRRYDCGSKRGLLQASWTWPSTTVKSVPPSAPGCNNADWLAARASRS